jgi:Sulfatase-modifying factor enzyme 1
MISNAEQRWCRLSGALPRRVHAVAAISALVWGCGNPELPVHPSAIVAPPEAQPAFQSVGGGKVEVGLARWVRRGQANVASFRITTYPITVNSYRMCVDSGVCTVPVLDSGVCGASDQGVFGSTYAEEANDAQPVTCVTPAQAQSYCTWLGGRLPRAEEWLLAARGPQARRFPWGDTAPTCDLHWAGADTDDSPETCCGGSCDELSSSEVGLHPNGKSAYGLEDILTAPGGELVGSEAGSTVCSAGVCRIMPKRGAIGAIDHAVPLIAQGNRLRGPDIPTYSFRCVEGGAQ